jgi:hypothetical protein
MIVTLSDEGAAPPRRLVSSEFIGSRDKPGNDELKGVWTGA